MDLTQIRKSINDIGDDEAIEIIMAIRANRRIPKKSGGGSRGKKKVLSDKDKLKKLLKEMSPAEIDLLLSSMKGKG